MGLPAPPFDTDAILQGFRPGMEGESPTWDAAAVNRMTAMAQRDLVLPGTCVEHIPAVGTMLPMTTLPTGAVTPRRRLAAELLATLE